MKLQLYISFSVFVGTLFFLLFACYLMIIYLLVIRRTHTHTRIAMLVIFVHYIFKLLSIVVK